MPPIVIKKLQCVCGSTFFVPVRAEQYATGGYGTAEFRSVSQAPKTFLVCLCGRPAFPQPSTFAQGTSAGIAEKDFQESQKSAMTAIESQSLTNIANIAAAPSEVEDLRKQVEDLKATVEALTRKDYAADLKEAVKPVRRPRQKAADAREGAQSNGGSTV
jgi:hypothetical protein